MDGQIGSRYVNNFYVIKAQSQKLIHNFILLMKIQNNY
jgi:hypothetical protein